MGVVQNTLNRWETPIPVKWDTLTPIERQCLDEYNERLGSGLFVPAFRNNPRAYIRIDPSQSSKCDIGCRTSTVQVVGYGLAKKQEAFAKSEFGAKNKTEVEKAKVELDNTIRFTIMHELGHCLGLAHEQFHSAYPWDNSDKPTKAKGRFAVGYDLTINVPSNDAIKDTLISRGLRETALMGFLNRRQDPHYHRDITTHCDFYSIMMYSNFREAALAAKTIDSSLHVNYQSKLMTSLLSPGDVMTIRTLYGLG